MHKTLCNHYYNLHQIPELSDHMDKTKEYIISHLPPCTLHIIERGGILAYFDFHQMETIAFRCETDALPLQEENNTPYTSKHPNQMHACGHDGHMAILLTLAQQLPHLHADYNVLLLFEYAEETFGGAKQIIASPFFTQYNIIATYALHIWPSFPKHKIITSQHLFASSCDVQIIIHGLSSHIAQAQEGIDANEIAGQFLTQATMHFSDFLVRFGIIKGGQASNILSDKTILQGSLRSLQPQNADFAKRYLWQLATLYMMRYQNIIEVQFKENNPPTINDIQLMKHATLQYPDLEIQNISFFATESFAHYQPSLYVLLGSGTNIPLHTTNYQFPLEILDTGYQYFHSLLTKAAADR